MNRKVVWASIGGLIGIVTIIGVIFAGLQLWQSVASGKEQSQAQSTLVALQSQQSNALETLVALQQNSSSQQAIADIKATIAVLEYQKSIIRSTLTPGYIAPTVTNELIVASTPIPPTVILPAVPDSTETSIPVQATVYNRTLTILVDDTTQGYLNQGLVTSLDSTQPQFPAADVTGGDPTLNPAAEPDLGPVSNILGNWFSFNPLQLNSNWGGPRDIPKKWATNNEVAVIYLIDGGTNGITDIKGNFGVDNGIFVWVNGIYQFGAVEPGHSIAYEYHDISLGNVPAGQNYIEILLEDHGRGGEFTIKITGRK